MNCTADLLLTFVWDETASGTARSKTSVLLLTVPEAVLSHTKARSRSAVQSINFEQNLCLAPRCPRGSLVPYNSEEQISFNSFCAPRCPRGSLVPYKCEENQFHPVLASLGPGAPMPFTTMMTMRPSYRQVPTKTRTFGRVQSLQWGLLSEVRLNPGHS